MDSKRLIDTFKQIPLQIVLLVLTGFIAVFATLIPELLLQAIAFITKGPSSIHDIRFDSIISGIVGLIASGVAMYQFMIKPGVDNAIFAQRADGEKAKINFIYPAILVLISVGVYAVICYFVDFQFIAHPVKYLAQFFAKVFGEEIKTGGNFDATVIPAYCKYIGFGIVLLAEIPCMFLGYMKGFKERLAGNSLL